MNKKLLITLLIIIIITSILSSSFNYNNNIEKFINLPSLNSIISPNNNSNNFNNSLTSFKKNEPINYSCYDFLKKKKWNVNSYTDTQNKVILTLRVLHGTQLSNINYVHPTKNAFVIPVEHFPIFDLDEKTKDSMSFKIQFENKKMKKIKNIILPFTDNFSYPQGLVLDFNDIDSEEEFLAIIDKLYELYDSDFVRETAELKRESNKLDTEVKFYDKELNDLNSRIAYITSEKKRLLNPNSECQIKIRENVDLQNTIKNLTNQKNNLYNEIYNIFEQIKDNANQINQLRGC